MTGTVKDYPEIVFLGTGSAKPSMTRNASCILLQIRFGVVVIISSVLSYPA